MIVLAKVCGFQFETTLHLFFLDNPGLAFDKDRVEKELLRMGDATVGPVSDAYVAVCYLTLVKE